MSEYQEKRAAERLPVADHVACVFASPVLEDFGKVKIKNISSTGIGLIVTEPVASGMQLVIKLVNPAKAFSKTMLIRVIHVTPQSGGLQLVGGSLEPPLTYEELCQLVM
jgi:glucose uptake protein GlcU